MPSFSLPSMMCSGLEGYLGSTRYAGVDDPDLLVEIALVEKLSKSLGLAHRAGIAEMITSTSAG